MRWLSSLPVTFEFTPPEALIDVFVVDTSDARLDQPPENYWREVWNYVVLCTNFCVNNIVVDIIPRAPLLNTRISPGLSQLSESRKVPSIHACHGSCER